jgi:hypothetical protein
VYGEMRRRAPFCGPSRCHGPSVRGFGVGVLCISRHRRLRGLTWCGMVGGFPAFGSSHVISRPQCERCEGAVPLAVSVSSIGSQHTGLDLLLCGEATSIYNVMGFMVRGSKE